MSKSEFLCKADNRIKCDMLYSLNEFHRQLTAATSADGTVYFFTGDDSGCPCRPSDCPRYRAALHAEKAAPKCPYDVNLKCNATHQVEELQRQTRELAEKVGANRAVISNWLFESDKSHDKNCIVPNYKKCLRYIAAQKTK